ncbi:hypothetical protein DPEC_G00162760 [Dallia pectoralis]|uniref:Uncharacterized protein n=1 Tax=Dallia pectoralis TaxID=75939 RepID=A0ACC2GGY3_DALPE|nr:hypothetical protein DPEC_G00162760 [Dallia pectoralis]
MVKAERDGQAIDVVEVRSCAVWHRQGEINKEITLSRVKVPVRAGLSFDASCRMKWLTETLVSIKRKTG